jgi:flagellar biosynthesis protein FliQ
MSKYDQSEMQEYAASLYNAARWLTLRWALGLAIIGIVVGLALVMFTANTPVANSSPVASMLIFAGMGVLLGLAIGHRKSFEYRLKAQTVLCQVQMELNTRLAHDQELTS